MFATREYLADAFSAVSLDSILLQTINYRLYISITIARIKYLLTNLYIIFKVLEQLYLATLFRELFKQLKDFYCILQ